MHFLHHNDDNIFEDHLLQNGCPELLEQLRLSNKNKKKLPPLDSQIKHKI